MVALIPIVIIAVITFFSRFIDPTIAATPQHTTAYAATVTDKIIAQNPGVTIRVRLARWELRGKGVGTSHKHPAKYHG